MTRDDRSTDHGIDASRRLFLRATAASGMLAGFGGVASGRGESGTRDQDSDEENGDGPGYVSTGNVNSEENIAENETRSKDDEDEETED